MQELLIIDIHLSKGQAFFRLPVIFKNLYATDETLYKLFQ